MVARSSIVDGSNNHPDELSSLKAIVVTREHKAIYPQERARIQKVSSHTYKTHVRDRLIF